MKDKGVTLLELSIAMAISTILFFIVGIIVHSSVSAWIESERRLRLNEEAYLSARMFEKIVHENKKSVISAGGDELKVISGSNSSKLWLDSGILKATLNGGATFDFLLDVTDVDFSHLNSSKTVVGMNLDISAGTEEMNLKASAQHRKKI